MAPQVELEQSTRFATHWWAMPGFAGERSGDRRSIHARFSSHVFSSYRHWDSCNRSRISAAHDARVNHPGK